MDNLNNSTAEHTKSNTKLKVMEKKMKTRIKIDGTYNRKDAIAYYNLNAAPITKRKMEKLEKEGFSFIPGNNPFLNKTKKWSGFECIRVAQTNSRVHGKCIATMWAVR